MEAMVSGDPDFTDGMAVIGAITIAGAIPTVIMASIILIMAIRTMVILITATLIIPTPIILITGMKPI